MERRLAAIVCADVAGYSRMMGADEEGTHATFKAHRSAIYPIILNHGGRLVKNTGDGFLLEFPSVVGALESAIAMQTLMAERNEPLARRSAHAVSSRRPHGRCDGRRGRGFRRWREHRRPSRIRSPPPAASPFPAKAYQEASKHLSVPLVDAGSHRFKNIEEPIRRLDLGSGRIRKPSAGSSTRHDRICRPQYRTAIVGVLPFANLSDSADEYFSDGLTEDLIHALSLQSFFRVLSRNATFSFKGKNLEHTPDRARKSTRPI